MSNMSLVMLILKSYICEVKKFWTHVFRKQLKNRCYGSLVLKFLPLCYQSKKFVAPLIRICSEKQKLWGVLCVSPSLSMIKHWNLRFHGYFVFCMGFSWQLCKTFRFRAFLIWEFCLEEDRERGRERKYVKL